MKTVLILIMGIVSISPTFADQTRAPAEAAPKSERSKSLQFDDAVVEGVNQDVKDSVESVEKGGGRGHQHLYQKRSDFKPEIKRFSSDMGYSP